MEGIKKARVILIGCGPHARRVYVPALAQIAGVELLLVVDLKSQEATVRSIDYGCLQPEFWFFEPFLDKLPRELYVSLSSYVSDNKITGVIIATEPLVHKMYAKWALQNGLNVLMDKPVTARAFSTSQAASAEGILEDYFELLEEYNTLQLKKESIFVINSHRRFHEGFQFVADQIREIGEKTNCPVTYIQAYHCDGQWRLPSEIVTQEYHPYCFGYGKASHSGYHIFDTIYQFYNAAGVDQKFADSMEIVSSFIQPNGFFSQITDQDYRRLFGEEEYNSVSQWTEDQLRELCGDFGEIDISAIITLKKQEEAVANVSVNLIHNGYAGRTWIQPGKDLYKGNGRIKHESYNIQQGPFQNIQIHAYQGYDKHDEENGQEDFLGGKNHFDIYVFRNPLVADSKVQPKVYSLSDLRDKAELKSDSMITMEMIKYKVVAEFVGYLTGGKKKEEIKSQIEDHLVPVQMMSGIYRSHILRQRDSSNLVKSHFGLEKTYN